MDWLRICLLVILVITVVYAQNRRCGRPCGRALRPVCARNPRGVRRTFKNPCEMRKFNCIRRTRFRLVRRGRCSVIRPTTRRTTVTRRTTATFSSTTPTSRPSSSSSIAGSSSTTISSSSSIASSSSTPSSSPGTAEPITDPTVPEEPTTIPA